MESLERLLKAHPFLAGLSEDQIAFMCGCAANRRFEAGQFLVREGTEADTIYLVRSGLIALEVHVPGKGVMRVESLDEGDVIGWSALFPPYRWTADARVVETALVLTFDAVCLRPKMEADHSLGYAIAMRLLGKVHERLDHVRMQRLDLYRA